MNEYLNPRSKKNVPTKYSESRTIPGQALTPAAMLKRHLAGTMPDIDLSRKYEYHFDETGKQVAEPLPLEVHELHKLSVMLRKRQYEEALEHKKQQAQKHKEQIISEYEKLQAEKSSAATPAKKPDPGEGAVL